VPITALRQELSTGRTAGRQKQKLRHRSAAGMSNRWSGAWLGARIPPISPAFPRSGRSAIKAAAPLRCIRCAHRCLRATIPQAQALVIRPLPRRKQRQTCLRIRHHVPNSWSACARWGHEQYRPM